MKCIVSKPGWYSGNALDIFGRCLGRSLARTWAFLAGGGYSSVPLGAGSVPL